MNYDAQILDELVRLNDRLFKPSPDNRFFIPDETCTTFYLSNTLLNSTDGEVFNFKIPDKQKGVIALVNINAGTFQNLSIHRVVLTKDGGLVANVVPIAIHGALNNVNIIDATTGLATAGFPVSPAGGANECRISLEPGASYRVLQQGGPHNLSVTFFGWTWPYEHKA